MYNNNNKIIWVKLTCKRVYSSCNFNHILVKKYYVIDSLLVWIVSVIVGTIGVRRQLMKSLLLY